MKLLVPRRGTFFIELILNGLFVIIYFLLKNNLIAFDENIIVKLNDYLEIYKYCVPFVVLLSLMQFYLRYKCMSLFFRYHIFSVIIFVPMFISYGDLQFTAILGAAHFLSTILSVRNTSFIEGEKTEGDPWEWLAKLKLKPTQIVSASFFLVIALGTILLATPFAWEKNQTVSVLDALFTATSATCVTGLSVLSLSDTFNTFGELVTLLLIQIGGLGLMTLSSSMVIILGRKFGVKGKIFMQDILDTADFKGILNLISDIIKYTFVIELLGAMILTVVFTYEGQPFTSAIYSGVFHSISAFCNAGFSLFNNSMEAYRDNIIVNWTIMLLIILGGLGFIVLKELRYKLFEEKSLKNFSTHSKIVFWANGILFGGGAIYIYLSEFLNSLSHLPLLSQIHVSLFQSVVTRTAGFNSVPLADFQMGTIFVMVILMIIGASPGSTGGGIKTTTIAVVFQSIRTILTGKSDVEFFKQKIPSSLVIRAIALVIISISTVVGFLLAMIHFEADHSFMELTFETVSAFATVGLSLGITPELGAMAKVLLTILMFIGRVGPLTLVLAVGEKIVNTGRKEYPEARVLIG